MSTARFWIRWNGDWVKLTLRGDNGLGDGCAELVVSEQTEEGWRREYQAYWIDGDVVACSVVERERDCDGLHEYAWEGFCPLADLRAREPYDATDATYTPEVGVARCLPAWREADRHQRDYTAEGMGY